MAGSGLSASVATAGAPVKVALTLASTAAAGTLGIATVPAVDHHHGAIGLPGGEPVHLPIAESSPPEESETQISVRAEHAESASRTDVPDPGSDPVEQQVTEFTLPTMARAPSEVRLAPVVEPGAQLPPEPTSPTDEDGTDSEQDPENPESDDGVGRSDPDPGETGTAPEHGKTSALPGFSGGVSAEPAAPARPTAGPVE